jgi:hypothetical protein
LVEGVVRLVGGQGDVGVAVAELGEGVTFPGLALAAVLGQLVGVEKVRKGGEGATGIDLGELVVVTDKDDLGAVGLGVVEESGELAGADHGRFVDDEHAAARDSVAVRPVEVGQQPTSVVEGMPEPSWSSAAALADRAAPIIR